MRTFLGAVSFLTNLPVRGETASPGRAALFFPLVGAVLGASGAGIFLAAIYVVPVWLAALLTAVFWTAISRAMTLNSIAGAVAIVVGVIARWQAVEHLATTRVVEIFVAAEAVPRAAMVALAWIARPAADGSFFAALTTPAAFLAIAQGIVAALACGFRPGITILVGSYLLVRAARWYSYRRIGGVNPDGLRATAQLLEIFILVLFIW